jgi:hypothetical protein
VGAAVSEREPIKKTIRKGARRMADALGGITQGQLDRIAKYGIVSLVEKYRGAVPFGVALAMVEHESNFEPLIYNYYPVENGKKNTKKLGRAFAKPAAPLVAKWTAATPGPCEFDPHACGLLQILDQIRVDQGGYGGVKLPYLNDLFDPAKNLHAALAGRDSDARRIVAVVPGVSGALLAALIYMAHAEGLGKLVGGRGKAGAFDKLKSAGQAVTWVNLCALPWGAAGWWTLGNRLSGIAKTAARAAVWEEARPRLVSGVPVAVGADASAPVVAPPDPAEALLMAVQAAEMERDLVTATALRAQLEQLVALQTSAPGAP